MNEIEEIHRAILARMDASDRRAAERERRNRVGELDRESRESIEASVAEREEERAVRRAEQEARLKKWNETLDRFFEILEDMRRKLDRVN